MAKLPLCHSHSWLSRDDCCHASLSQSQTQSYSTGLVNQSALNLMLLMTHSIADDVGLNVLRCWADMLGRKNTALLMMWAWMSSDVELTCVLLLGTKTQHCQEVLSFILTEDVCFSHKNKYFMHFCFVLSMYRHSDCVALACFTLILLLTVIYGLVLIVPNSH